MAGPVYIGQAELEAQYTPRVVRDLFCDDGSRQPGPRLGRACAIASRLAEGPLLKAWTTDQLLALMDDEAVQMAVCKLAMAVGGDGKPEWTGDGAPFANGMKDALAQLDLLAKAQLRSRTESEGAGQNPTVRGSIASPEERQFMFAPSNGRPKPGGY